MQPARFGTALISRHVKSGKARTLCWDLGQRAAKVGSGRIIRSQGAMTAFQYKKFPSHGIGDTDHNTIRRSRNIHLLKNWKLVCDPFWTLLDASTNLAHSCASMTSETSRRDKDLQPFSRSVDGCRLKRVPRIDRHAAHVNTRNRSRAQQSDLSKSCADQSRRSYRSNQTTFSPTPPRGSRHDCEYMQDYS